MKREGIRSEVVVSTLYTSFPHVEAYSIPAPSWLRTKPGSANLIFLAGAAPLRDEAFSLKTIAC